VVLVRAWGGVEQGRATKIKKLGGVHTCLSEEEKASGARAPGNGGRTGSFYRDGRASSRKRVLGEGGKKG